MRNLLAFPLVLLMVGTIIPISNTIEASLVPFMTVPPGLSFHEPISIDGNDDLNSTAISMGFIGSGTPEDPYVMQDIYIDANGTSYCISISNTSLPFLIDNCVFENATDTTVDPMGSGMRVIRRKSFLIKRC